MTWINFAAILATGLLTIAASVTAQIVAAKYAHKRAERDRLLDQKRELFVRVLDFVVHLDPPAPSMKGSMLLNGELMLYDIRISAAFLDVLTEAKQTGSASPATLNALSEQMAISLGTQTI